jgi:hypothetical protein
MAPMFRSPSIHNTTKPVRFSADPEPWKGSLSKSNLA